jgi:hypothetical protein
MSADSAICVERHKNISERFKRNEDMMVEQETKIETLTITSTTLYIQLGLLIKILTWFVGLVGTGFGAICVYGLQKYFFK